MRPWLLVVVILTTAPAAAAPLLLCDAAATNGDDGLAEAVSAVFPRGRARGNAADCAEPLKLLRYGDADVLVTKKGGPNASDCHGCGATLTAYVLRRAPDGVRLAASFVDFIETGTNGDAGRIDGIQLAGHDALGIESGGTFQGYTSSTVGLFIFRDRRLDALTPALPLSASNEGAAADEAHAVSVDGAWRIDPARPDAVTIDYLAKSGGKSRRSSATWLVEGKTLALSSGKIPPEYATAGGQ